MQSQKSIRVRFGAGKTLAAAFIFMLMGTAMELYLLDHYEDLQQLIPLVCIGVSILLMAAVSFRRTSLLTRGFMATLILTALSGVYGTFLHLQANYEFEQEMKPGATTWEWLLDSFSGALPALAPGSMIALALIGYSYIQLLNKK